MKRECLVVALLLASACLSAGCSDGGSPTAPAPPPPTSASLTLKSISPPRGTVLPHGRTTNFQATLSYNLGTATFGNVAVATAGAAPLFLVIPGPVQRLNSTSGDVTLDYALNVPNGAAGGTLHMSFSLFASGSSSTSSSFVETYKVAP